MTKKVRDSLFIIFIGLFIFMTVVISLYASGYRFNLSWPLKFNRLLQKTGMLAVKTDPAHAIVYLNDVPQKNLSINPWKKDYLTTPTKIKNLLPGEYELRLEQEGYWPFKQKIYINSGETTFVENVNLFKENLPLLILATPESKLALSPDKKHLYLSQTKKIIDLKTEIAKSLNYTDNTSGVWLKNSKLLVAGTIFDPNRDNNDVNYSGLIGSEATNWYLDEANNYLYYQSNNSINRLGISNNNTSSIVSGNNYIDYEVRTDNLFILSNAQGQIKLSSYSFKDARFDGEWTLPNSGHYSFVRDIPNYLAVYDDQNKTLYLFNEAVITGGPSVIRNINNWVVADSQSLIYTNDFEVYVYNFNNSNVDLITRRSEQITSIFWNATGNYLIFTGPNTLNVLDFKNRNSTLLFRAEKISSPVLDEKNNYLYFWAKIGQQEGVYKMLMQ